MSALHELDPGTLQLGERGRRWAFAALSVSGLGWLGSLLAVGLGHAGSERFFRSYLVSFMFCLSLALGALFFILITHLTRAAWSVALRRVAEAVSLTIVPLFVLALGVFWGRHELYEWTSAVRVEADELLQHKRGYLNSGFFLGRILFYFAVWSVLALYFSARSAAQDRTRDVGATLQMERLAAPGMIFYAMTLTFAAFDFLMSLYPHWYSTIFGVYYFAGSVLALFSLVTLLVAALQSAGKLSGVVSREHYHDLGKMMFAFVVFWAYIAFSQYMLIWTGGIPEETVWYHTRQQGPWAALSLFLLAGHFFLPFFWLMSRYAKQRRGMLVVAAVWLLLMHWFDLFWLVMPEAVPGGFPFHLLDLTCLMGVAGVVLACTFWRLARVPLIPVGDPRLAESLGAEHV